MQVSRMTEKGQITIPKELRESLGLRPGDQVEFRALKNGLEVRKQINPGRFAQYKGHLGHLKGKTSKELLEEMRGTSLPQSIPMYS